MPDIFDEIAPSQPKGDIFDQVAETPDPALASAVDAYKSTPYVFGGNKGPKGTDCSGFIQDIVRKAYKVVLPRVAASQFNDKRLQPVDPSPDKMAPGDLVFFKNTYKPGVSHVAIYMGGGRYADMRSSAKDFQIGEVGDGLWTKHLAGVKRLPPMKEAPDPLAGSRAQVAKLARSVPKAEAPSFLGGPPNVPGTPNYMRERGVEPNIVKGLIPGAEAYAKKEGFLPGMAELAISAFEPENVVTAGVPIPMMGNPVARRLVAAVMGAVSAPGVYEAAKAGDYGKATARALPAAAPLIPDAVGVAARAIPTRRTPVMTPAEGLAVAQAPYRATKRKIPTATINKETPTITPNVSSPVDSAGAITPVARPATGIREVPTAEIVRDPARFQYKVMVGAKGTTGELSNVKVWNPDLAGVGLVWRDPVDGKTYAVNMHNRHELAERLNVPSMAVRYIDAPTASAARTTGALANIAEGRGTAIDAAKLFREAGLTAADIEGRGVSLKGKMAEDGMALSELPEGLWRMVYKGEMPVNRGIAIGGTGLNQSGQMALYQALAKKKGGERLTDAEVREFARVVQSAGETTQKVETLFGDEEVTKNNFFEKAKLITWVKKEIASDRSLFGKVGKEQNAAKLEGAGSKIDIAEAQRISEEAATLNEVFDRLAYRSSPVADALNEAAARLAKGESADAVRTSLKERVRSAVQEALGGGEGRGVEPIPANPAGGVDPGGGDLFDQLGFADAPAPAKPLKSAPARRGGARASVKADTPTGLYDHPATTKETAPASGAVASELERMDDPRPRVKPVPGPELVRLAVDILGKYPTVKKLPKALGLFYAKGKGAGGIALNPVLGKNPKNFAATLAHEIGHAVDWLPEGAMDRGNILGRIGTLRNYLMQTLDALPTDPSNVLTVKDRRLIRKRAEAAIGPRPSKDVSEADWAQWAVEVSEKYKELIAEEIDARNLITRQEIHEELAELSEWWKPGIYDGGPGYQRYRLSSEELYADAISVWLNAPKELAERAPKFNEAMQAYLGRKPQVIEAYTGIQKLLRGTPEELATAREADILAGFEKGEEKRLAASKEKPDQQPLRDYIAQTMFDAYAPALEREQSLVKGGAVIPPDRMLRYALDELNLKDNVNHRFLLDVDKNILAPLKEDGLTMNDLGLYLFYRRVESGRHDLLNPLGHDPVTAQEGMAALRTRVGAEKFRKVEQGAETFYESVFHAAEELMKAGGYNKNTFAQTVLPNKGSYSAFAVLDYIDSDAVPAAIRQQIGTVKPVENPFVTTLLKTMAVNRLTEIQKAKNLVIGQMKTYFPEDLVKVRVAPKQRPPHPKGGKGYLTVLENGAPAYYETDAYTAKMFERPDASELARPLRLLRDVSHKVFHPLFVTYNPGFMAFNVLRDMTRAWTNLGAAKGISLREVVVEYVKALPPAARRAWNKHDPLIERMIDERALDIPFSELAVNGESAAYDRMLQRYGLAVQDGKAAPMIVKPILWVLDQGKRAGDMLEAAGKVGPYRTLEKRGIPAKERAHIVRNYVGTPNWRRHGLSRDYMNSLAMYANVALQGWRADMEIGLAPKTRAGWWVRSAITAGLPKVAVQAAAAGAFGIGVAELMKRVPSYDRANYVILPVGERDGRDGKETVYLRLPHGDTQRMFGGILYHLLRKEWSGAAGFVGGHLPSQAPPLNIGSKWLEFAQGRNPQDDFRNREIVGRDEFKVGGMTAAQDMLQWSGEQFGVLGQPLRAMKIPQEGRPESWIDKLMMIPGVERMVKSSRRGVKEEEYKTIDRYEAVQAARRLQRSEVEKELARQKAHRQKLKAASKAVPVRRQ